MSGSNDASGWSMFGGDRRRHPRKFLSGTAYLLLPNQTPVEVHALDISSGGLGVVAPMSLPHERYCEIRFTLAREPYGLDQLTTPVQVVHCVLSGREHGFLLGLEFVDLPEKATAVINRYMNAKSTMMGLGDGG
jgi:c-di-GMP-binding flagellar brake protein YcgR